MNSYLRAATASAATLVSAAGLAACGGSSGNTSDADVGKLTSASSAVKCGAGTGKPATGAPIKVRALATASGGIDFSSAPRSAAAYFKCVNANGGINGRRVDYAYEDDALNQQKAAQIAAKFAADRSVVALAGDATFIGCGAANPIYKKADLFSITGAGVSQACFESSNIAPINAGPRISGVATLQYLQAQGKTARFAQARHNIPGVGDWVADGVETFAKDKGVQVVETTIRDASSVDANSGILKLKDAKPSAVLIEDVGPVAVALLKAAATQGLQKDVTWSCLASCYDAGFPKQIGAQWEGFVANSELQLVDAKTTDNLQWRTVLQKYGKPQDPRDTFGQAGFLAAKVLTDALLALDPKDISRETVSKAVVGVKGYKSDILCDPWYFGSAERHNANHTTRMATIKGGKYVELEGCKPVQDAALAPVIAREQRDGLAD